MATDEHNSTAGTALPGPTPEAQIVPEALHQLLAAARLADECQQVMDQVDPRDVLALFALVSELRNAVEPLADYARHVDSRGVAYLRKLQPEDAAELTDDEISALVSPDNMIILTTGDLREQSRKLTMGQTRIARRAFERASAALPDTGSDFRPDDGDSAPEAQADAGANP
jgi:hypothetical protein